MLAAVVETWTEILKIQKFRRIVSYTGFYCFVTVLTYGYTNNTTRAGYSRDDQYYASYPAGTELLTDTTKASGVFCISLHSAMSLRSMSGGRLSIASWLSISSARGSLHMHIMLSTYANHMAPAVSFTSTAVNSILGGRYTINTWHTCFLMDNSTAVDNQRKNYHMEHSMGSGATHLRCRAAVDSIFRKLFFFDLRCWLLNHGVIV
ncbi:hypothetical protein AKJ16_DCAP08961 [Drosera capensis]